MLTYNEAKEYLIEAFLNNIAIHDSGDYWQIGAGYNEFETHIPRNDNPMFKKLFIALNFWDGWQDARNHDWKYYDGISKNDWPQLAKIIIQNIKEEKEITNFLILRHFGSSQ